MENFPLYDVEKTYQENLVNGPQFQGELPKRAPVEPSERIDFLGVSLASPIGVAAGPLLDAKWTALAASLGFDLVTYKTIRSSAHPSHPLPNIVPVKTPGPLLPGQLPQRLVTADSFTPLVDEETGVTNSFGNPSQSPDFLRQDIKKARESLLPDQALIVSVFGTEKEGVSAKEDFAATAHFAKLSGAPLIEANFSCPNVAEKGGALYSSPQLVYDFSKRIVQAIGDTPLIIKVGAISPKSLLQQVLTAAAKAGVRAVCGLNTISREVVDKHGRPALGASRPTSGICGNPIREAALQFTQNAREIIDKEKLGLKLLSCGGISLPAHFSLFLNAGADIAMTASGMMWDPYLAAKYHSLTLQKGKELYV